MLNGFAGLKNSLVDKMFHLTAKEIDFLLYAVSLQDEYGLVYGLHYRDVCEHIHISIQGFYDILHSLQSKNIIGHIKSNRTDHDVLILGNRLVTDQDRAEGYIRIKENFFFSDEFLGLKAGAKLIALYAYRHYSQCQSSYRIRDKKFFEIWTERLQVNKRCVRIYLKQLRSMFSVGEKDGIIYITSKKEFLEEGHVSNKAKCRRHYIEMLCRRQKIYSMPQKDISDTAGLLAQYQDYAQKAGKDICVLISQAIETSLGIINRGKKLKRSWLRQLRPKLVHKVLRNLITA